MKRIRRLRSWKGLELSYDLNGEFPAEPKASILFNHETYCWF